MKRATINFKDLDEVIKAAKRAAGLGEE